LCGGSWYPIIGGVPWWRRPPELDARTLNDLIRFLMEMDATLNEILESVRRNDDEEA
jgi:hypothetical protein